MDWTATCSPEREPHPRHSTRIHTSPAKRYRSAPPGSWSGPHFSAKICPSHVSPLERVLRQLMGPRLSVAMTPFYPPNLNYFVPKWLLMRIPAFLQDAYKLGVDGCPAPRYGAPHTRKNSSCCGTGGAGSGLRHAKNIGRTSDHLEFRLESQLGAVVMSARRADSTIRDEIQSSVKRITGRLFRRTSVLLQFSSSVHESVSSGVPIVDDCRWTDWGLSTKNS
jgi:hypothetical protein